MTNLDDLAAKARAARDERPDWYTFEGAVAEPFKPTRLPESQHKWFVGRNGRATGVLEWIFKSCYR